MRFHRYSRFEFQDTPLKRAALLRKQREERESLPLFADQVADEQPSVDSVMARRRQLWSAHEARDRARRAAKWREGRARMRAYPHSVQVRLMAYWNKHRWLPGDPSYFIDMMHMHDSGQLNLDTLATGGKVAERRLKMHQLDDDLNA